MSTIGSDARERGVSVVIVTFNSAATIHDCLRSIPPGSEVIVVDQASTDETREVVRKSGKNVTLISAGRNRGFGAGCNLGAANATRGLIAFLNPDACFHEGALEQLAERVTELGTLVGPRILGATGKDETRARHWSTFVTDVAEIIWPPRFTPTRLKRDISTNSSVYRTGGFVPYLQGSCLVLPKSLFDSVGGFDEEYFLYHEEEVLAAKAFGLGLAAYLDVEAVITHLGAKSTGQVSLFAARQYYRSRTLAYKQADSTGRAFCKTAAVYLALQIMSASSPLRTMLGFHAERGCRWYRAAAAGAVAGFKQTYEVPPRIATS